MTKRVLSGLLMSAAALATGVGGYLIVTLKPQPPPSVAPPPRRVAVQVEQVEQLPFTQYVRVNGTVEPLSRARLAAEVPGEVVAMPPGVELGARVRPRQLLLQIKDVPFRIDRDKKRALLARQQASVELEQTELRRKQKLLEIAREKLKLAQTELQRKLAMEERGFVSRQAVDLARRDLENARWEYEQAVSNLEGGDARLRLVEAELASAKADLDRADEALRDTRVHAPFEGFLSEKRVNVGDRVAIGQLLFTVVDLSKVKGVATVSAQDVALLRSGQEVVAVLERNPPRRFSGVLDNIGVESDLRSRTFPIEVLVPNDAEHTLLPGMFVELRIKVRDYPQALLIPRHVVMQDADSSAYLFVADLERQVAVKRFITLGPRFGTQYLVGSGLRPGERIVSAGQELLTDGDFIEVLSRQDGARPSFAGDAQRSGRSAAAARGRERSEQGTPAAPGVGAAAPVAPTDSRP
ncbi:MAG: efflux RND transporter periplasmic adaptor subunit [Candidatus Tectomicrobia bacterium]|nr:efflux RND transporter periplasmic adaptor subunit [Candidatus Tectomicrobia bacterium]